MVSWRRLHGCIEDADCRRFISRHGRIHPKVSLFELAHETPPLRWHFFWRSPPQRRPAARREPEMERRSKHDGGENNREPNSKRQNSQRHSRRSASLKQMLRSRLFKIATNRSIISSSLRSLYESEERRRKSLVSAFCPSVGPVSDFTGSAAAAAAAAPRCRTYFFFCPSTSSGFA